MTARKQSPHQPHWPPRPCTAAYNLEGLTMAIADIVHQDGAAGIHEDRRIYLQLAAIAAAAEVYSRELAHWFGSRMGEDHELLESLQDRFEAASAME